MKTLIAVIFLGFIFFSVEKSFSMENKAMTAEDPKNEASGTWDFGKIAKDSIVEHVFILNNDTGSEMKILDVNTSCGCTVTELDKKVLGPGESSKIRVKLNSKGYLGEIKQYIFVATDNKDKPVEKFTIKAFVE